MDIPRHPVIGGKLFDQGMYGCMFAPALHCKYKKKLVLDDTKSEGTKPEDNVNYPITKIILKEDAEMEYSIGNMIRRIPLWKNYFSVSESICLPSPAQTDKDLSYCKPLEGHEIEEFRILSMTYSGLPLSIYRFQMKGFDFMSFVMHLLEAGALMTLYGLVHRDLHKGNILVDQYNVPRIIDFNLSIMVKSDITDNTLAHSYNPIISQLSPDYVLVNAANTLKRKASGVFQSNKSLSNRVIDATIDKKPIMKKVSAILGIPMSEMRQQLYQFYIKSKSVQSGNLADWFHVYWRVVDSWAIGINIIELISNFSQWREFGPIYAQHRDILLPMLRRLCAVDPTQRIDCVQAIHYLDPTNFIIRKYGEAWMKKVGTF